MVGVPVGIKSSVAHEISQGSDGGHDGIGDVSTELGKFACDFEKEILLPLREKRAASDEVLAIQPVASGMVRDPGWEGVIDGEVCGLGALAETVRTFLHWVPIKLNTRDALRLCVSCGDALSREGEFNCARDFFYRYVTESCKDIERRRSGRLVATTHNGYTVQSKQTQRHTTLVKDEASWAARAEFGLASMELRLTLTRDPHVRFPATLREMVAHLRRIQYGMDLILSLPKEDHDAVSWLVLEGTFLLFDWCEPLSVTGHGAAVAEFLVWATLSMESMVNLSTVKHLPWRTRLTAATCYAYEDAGKPGAAANCAVHAIKKVTELRRQEAMDPPVPASVLQALDAAEADLRLLTFKYAAVVAAIEKRRAAEGKLGDDGSDRRNVVANAKDEGQESTFSEGDVYELLTQYIPDVEKRPAALIELLGRTSSSAHVAGESSADGVLTSSERRGVCKLAIALLLPDATASGEVGAVKPGEDSSASNGENLSDGSGGGESRKGSQAVDAKMHGGEADDGTLAQRTFPLDIDQEVQLMREMYYLRDFQSLEAMLPLTKQRLRDAQASISGEDFRVFWFEIALWSSCMRLSTWRNKPEPKVASRGGLKKSPTQAAPTETVDPFRSGGEIEGATLVGGARAPPAAIAGATGIKGTSEESRERDSGSPAVAHDIFDKAGDGPGRGEKIQAINALAAAAVEVEGELHDALSPGSRQAEVVEVPLDGADRAGVRINLEPLLTVIGLVRKALRGSYRQVLERRGDLILCAITSMWEPYMTSILRALDGMPGEEEVDRALLDASLLAVETISAGLSVLNADDATLRATVALKLAILQADFRGEHRNACQTLRSALASVDRDRQDAVSHQLQIAKASSKDMEHHGHCVALGRRSVSASFQGEGRGSAAVFPSRSNEGLDPGAGGTGKEGDYLIESAMENHGVDMSFHELAALQLDMTSTLLRIELLMGRSAACLLAKHRRNDAKARLAARKNASKHKGNSHKVSKVTFGDSDGRWDTPAGSLALGWSVVNPGVTHGRGDGASALTGSNAVVCAAGAGALPGESTAFAEAARKEGILLRAHSAGATATATELNGRGFAAVRAEEIQSCSATETRLTAEYRHNPYARAMLLATMSRLRIQGKEQETLLVEAAGLLRQAKASEETLLEMLPGAPVRRNASSGRAPDVLENKTEANESLRGQIIQNQTIGKRDRVPTPASPFLLSRSHMSIELLPAPFPVPHAGQSTNFGVRNERRADDARKVIASNATSSKTISSRTERPTDYPKIVKVCVYGKPEGAGTGVTLSNTSYAGLGVSVPYDPETGECGAVTIRGLTPNESYVFAIGAFDDAGDLIGHRLGDVCAPIETLNPLPLTLCWAHLSRVALALGFPLLAGHFAQEVYEELMTPGAAAKLASSKAGQTRAHNVGGVRRGSQAGRKLTNLCDGWMASPLYGRAFSPIALHRCPRGVLQAFVQVCFVLVDTSDADEISKAAESGSAPLEEQVCRLTSLKRLSLACEAAVLLCDWDLVSRGVLRAYHLLLPLLRVAAMGRLLFQILCELHQCLSVVPEDRYDKAMNIMFTCLGYQIMTKGHELGEHAMARKTLLGRGQEPLATVEGSIIPTEHFSKPHDNNALQDDGNEVSDLVEQTSLVEVWTGHPTYRGADGDTSSELRRALNMTANSKDGKDMNEGADDGERNDSGRFVTTSEVTQRVMSAAHEDPVAAWELIKAEQLSRDDRPRLMCRVCRVALDRGMAKQVVSWLDQGASGSTSDEAADSPTRAAAGGCFLLAASALEPLTEKVLDGEGLRTTLSYISGALPRGDMSDAVGGGDVNVGNQEKSEGAQEEAGNAVEKEGREGEPIVETDNGETSRENITRDGIGNSQATPAECLQLLWLSEVEHILGAAYLQLAFAIPRKAGGASASPNDTPTGRGIPSVPPTEIGRAQVGERPAWGFGSGPFAEISATGPDVIGVGAARAEGADDEDERHTIQLLEDEGTAWPSANDIDDTSDKFGGDPGEVDINANGRGSLEGKSVSTFANLLSHSILCLTRAASRARWGRAWVKTERACGLLWNMVLSLWLSPQNFHHASDIPASSRREGDMDEGVCLGEYHARAFAKACEALLDAVDASNKGKVPNKRYVEGSGGCSGQGSDEGSADESMRDTAEHVDRFERVEGSMNGIGSDNAASLDIRWVSKFVEWGLQGILRCRCWGVAVKVASRLLSSTGGLYGGHRVYPLAVHAQKRLCRLASGLLLKREACLNALDADFHAAQAKQRRRKVLKAVETKSKEEIEHEQAREPHIQAVADARVRKQIHDHRLGTLVQSRGAYMKTKKIGRGVLDEAREALAEYVALLSPMPSGNGEVESALDCGGDNTSSGRPAPTFREQASVDLEKSWKEVLKLYTRAVDILREKRERELLTEALSDLGDLHILRGSYNLAAETWTDAVDGICSALDASKDWKVIFDELRSAYPSSGGPPGGGGSLALALGGWSCFAGGALLGKLSIFTGQVNMNGQLNLCLMAAEMFRAPLETSLPFPQRGCDYASYVPESLGGPGLDRPGLWIDDRSLSASSVHASLMHVQGVLTAAGCFKEALPVLAILEHVASRVIVDPLQLARARLARVECLTQAGFIAEAASAFAAVLTGKSVPTTTGDYAGRRADGAKQGTSAAPEAAPDPKGKGPPAKDKKGDKTKGKKGKAVAIPADGDSPSTAQKSPTAVDPRGLAKSGLPFYGLAPYENHLPLDHPDNAAAVTWLVGGNGANHVKVGVETGNPDENALISRHTGLLKRGLFGADATLTELHGENEACLVARARARLLLALACCSALPGVCEGSNSTSTTENAETDSSSGSGGSAVLRNVRDAADCILGEVLQVTMKSISPTTRAIPQALDDEGASAHDAPQATRVAAHSTTTLREADEWVPLMAAEALLLRARLALLDGKLRVCRHHSSRGLAVLLQQGLRGSPPLSHAQTIPTVAGTRHDKLDRDDDKNDSIDGANGRLVMFGDRRSRPWRVTQIWLELRHDLAVVALSQGRTKDATFQIRQGVEEAQSVGEAVISRRLLRLRAQAAVGNGELDQALAECRSLATVYETDNGCGLDHVAVLRLLAKIRRQQSMVCTTSKEDALAALSESIGALRLADSILLSSARGLGWIGTGVLTYASREDNVMMEDAHPRLLHALGTSFRDVPHDLPDELAFGLAPVDEQDAVAPSRLANLYLPPLRLLLAVRVSLLDALEGIGHHSLTRDVSSDTLNGGHETLPFQGEPNGDWIEQTSMIAEETAAVLRHVANPHPATRAHLLLLIGKLRCRRLLLLIQQDAAQSAASFLSVPHGRNRRASDPSADILEEATRQAFMAALRVTFTRGGHDRTIMTDACTGLVLLYMVQMRHHWTNSGGHVSRGEGHEEEGGDAQQQVPDVEHHLQLASHYLRLAASIAREQVLLDNKLDSVAVEPLPPAVVDSMPRSALDELAGRGGRGLDDDQRCLSARGLLQFMRARSRENSLAAAPTDLLPASTVCQIHALLYRHASVYREKCCVEEALLEPPMLKDSSAANLDAPGGVICVQWVWGAPLHPNASVANSEDMPFFPLSVDPGDEQLFPMRTAFVLLGSSATAEGQMNDDPRASGGNNVHGPSIVTVLASASKADQLRRRASQLKAMILAFKEKAPDTDVIPAPLEHRFGNLLKAVDDTLVCGRVRSFIPGAGAPDRGNTDRTNSMKDGNAEGRLEPTVANIDAIEGFFDTRSGVSVQNAGLLQFVRSAIYSLR